MHATTRDELFELGQLADDLLSRFVEIQNAIRSWRVVAFVRVSFEQHARDAHAIAECLDSLLDRLTAVAKAIEFEHSGRALRKRAWSLSLRIAQFGSSVRAPDARHGPSLAPATVPRSILRLASSP